MNNAPSNVTQQLHNLIQQYRMAMEASRNTQDPALRETQIQRANQIREVLQRYQMRMQSMQRNAGQQQTPNQLGNAGQNAQMQNRMGGPGNMGANGAAGGLGGPGGPGGPGHLAGANSAGGPRGTGPDGQHFETPQMTPQQLQAQQSRAEQAQQMSLASIQTTAGFQQRRQLVEELRRRQAEFASRLEKAEYALRQQPSAEAVQRINQGIRTLNAKREQYKQRELALIQEMRAALQAQPRLTRPGIVPPPNQDLNRLQNPNLNQAHPQPPIQNQTHMLAHNTPGLPPTQLAPSQAQAHMVAQQQAQARAQQAQLGQQQQQQSMQQMQQNPQQAQQGPAAAIQGQQQQQQPNLPGQPALSVNASNGQAQGPNQTEIDERSRNRNNTSLIIPPTLNVAQPIPVSVKPGRPSLSNGGASAASALNSPALTRVPGFQVGNDHVLSKRKLSELVSGVVGDTQETAIDGDVEEILLDLADEFVTSVTAFACRIAKHRRSDTLEAKDIQLHLERNWNVVIPGYASDEVRSIRKIQPAPAHVQRISSINMSRSLK